MIKDKLSAVNDYNADSIKALEGLEAVRKRPAMYIGNTNSTGLAHIVFEIFDNAVDEVLADFADTIELTFHEDGSVSIEDNGRGIPPEALELIFTTLHAGGKFDSSNYKSSGGLHGVGTSVTNAMSEWLEVTVYRNGKQHYLKFENGGHPIGKMRVIGTCDKNKTGTLVRFKPDASLFSTVKFNVERIEQRARETAFLNPKVKIIFNDFRSDDEELRFTNIFDYNGMGDYLTYLADNSTISIAPKEFTMLDEPTGIEATIAFQWVENDEASQENILSYVNNIRTRDGGTHETGFKTGLTKAFNQFGKDAGLLKGKYSKVLGEDIRDGMVAVISTKIPENILEFESQTKDKLGSIEARSVLEGFAYDIFIKFLSMNKSDAEYLIDRAIKYQKMKEEAKRLRDTAKKTNNKSKKLSMSDKLTEPSVKNYKRNELFIVEGDSAGGCHTIDTPIMLANNTVKTIGELLEDFNNGIDNYVYGFDNEHKKDFNVYKILDVFKTKKTKVIQLTFDDGSQVRVTPEHKYLLKNGEWKEAQNLKPTDSLRSLYLLKNKKGYVVNSYNQKHFKEHNMHTSVARKYLGEKPDGFVIHHRDGNKENNYPTNLEYIEFGEHSSFHNNERIKNGTLDVNRLANTHMDRWKNDSEYKERVLKVLNDNQKEYWANNDNRLKQSIKIKNYYKENPDIVAERSLVSKEQWKDESLLKFRSEKTKEQMAKVIEIKLNNSLDLIVDMKVNNIEFNRKNYMEQRTIKMNGSRKQKDGIYPYYTLLNKFNKDLSLLNREVAQHNHRVVKIEWLDEEVDVYDLTVDGVHNFALGNGVIVHNSAKNGRYKEFQGVLSLRGKVLNTIDSTHTEALTNAEIQTIVAALNCGMGNDYNEDDLHYDKVIIMTDADVDGSHIQVLLLTFFYKHMRKLIEDGHVYISSPPLYGITLNPKDKKPEKRYAWNQTELREILETAPKGVQVQRYKGLGEMGDVDIRDTTLNPEHRVLYKIEISDFIQANNTLNTLMGRDASKRRIWIEQNVEFLDDSDTYEFKEADYSLEDL